MDIEFMETDPEMWVIKEYGNNNEDLKVEDLTEVYAIVYSIKKKGKNEPEEIYTFTTDFEQAFKRFKLLPHTKCFLKRFLTDDDNLIKLAQDGTKPKITMEDLTDEQKEISLKEILGGYRDEDEEGNPIINTGFTAREAVADEINEIVNKQFREQIHTAYEKLNIDTEKLHQQSCEPKEFEN